MKLSELGEFGLIDRIDSITNKFKNPQHASWQRLLVGIGDDAAAWESDNHIQLATTDSLVQDIHFDLNVITWEELGYKALAVNLSDIAAMGGVPQYALISLALPGEVEVENIHKFYTSMMRLAEQFGVAIAGGDIVAAPNIVITITVIGCSSDKSILKRSTASPGEQVAVTGYLGLSAAGLEMLKRGISLDFETTTILRRGHFQPVPKVEEGQILVQQGIKTAIDISDGLIADLDHICEASKVSAKIKIEQVPVHPVVKANFPNYQELALYGGEDYELLFSANKTIIEQAKQALNCPVTVIGDITEESLAKRVTLVDGKGNIIPYKKGGWEHFRNESSKAKLA
jgi:thiamine-monophosphate kinase